MTADTHDVTTEPGDGLTVTEALDLAARDRDVLLERLRVEPNAYCGLILHVPSLWPTKHVRQVGWMRWAWTCTEHTNDKSEGKVLATGHAPTERWAWRQVDAAAKRIHDRRCAELKAKAADGGEDR